MSGVVVGVDDSLTARRAARRGASIAESLGVQLHLVTAVRRGRSRAVQHGTDRFVHDWVSDASQLLQSIKVQVRALDAQTSVERGKPAKAICAAARRLNADFIVVGNRGVQSASHVLGSIASDVLRNASCDVVVAHTWPDVDETKDRWITSCPAFVGCDAAERERIEALTTPIAVPAGTVLTRQGQIGKEFGVLREGSATVTIDGDVVATLGPGDHYGEMALLPSVGADANRTATVIADRDLEVSMMSVPEFSSLVVGFPHVAERLLETAEERAHGNARRRMPHVRSVGTAVAI